MTTDLQTLAMLYSLSGMLITALYIPQILAVVRAKNRLPDISLATWLTWACCMTVSVLYSYYVAGDSKIAMVSFFGSVFCFLISGTVIYKRIKYSKSDKLQKFSFFHNKSFKQKYVS